MKTVFPPSHHHNGFVATHARRHDVRHLGTWYTGTWAHEPYIMCFSAWVATKLLWWWPGGRIVFMIACILYPSCFCEMCVVDHLWPLMIIYIYIYIYIILSRINKTTMNILLKVSRFFDNLQVNVLLTKIFPSCRHPAPKWFNKIKTKTSSD